MGNIPEGAPDVKEAQRDLLPFSLSRSRRVVIRKTAYNEEQVDAQVALPRYFEALNPNTVCCQITARMLRQRRPFRDEK